MGTHIFHHWENTWEESVTVVPWSPLTTNCTWFWSAERTGPTLTRWKCTAQQGPGWLEHPSLQGWCGSSSGRRICTVHRRAAERGLLGSLAKLGLAWWLGTRQHFGELPIVYVITGMLRQLIINQKGFHFMQKCQSSHSDKMPLHPYYLSDASTSRFSKI